MKKCTNSQHVGNILLPLSNFSKRKNASDGHQSWCKDCCSQYRKRQAIASGKEPHKRMTYKEQLERNKITLRARKRKSPRHNLVFLLQNIRQRCKTTNVPFNVSADDFSNLPTHCPDLKVKLIYGNKGKASPYSATVDKIIPSLGYVPGNVRIISYKANVMKQDASFEEMKTIAESWLQLYNESVFTNQTATQTVLTGVKNDVQRKDSNSVKT